MTYIYEDPASLKIIIIAFVACILLAVGYGQVIKTFPNYAIYYEFYRESNMYIELFIFTMYAFITIAIFFKLNPERFILASLMVLITLSIDIAVPYTYKVNIIDWTKDIQYVCNNNPPNIIDTLDRIGRRDVVVFTSHSGGHTYKTVIDLTIGNMQFTVDDTGSIKEFLKVHKVGNSKSETYKLETKVKAYYLPNRNILLYLEDAE